MAEERRLSGGGDGGSGLEEGDVSMVVWRMNRTKMTGTGGREKGDLRNISVT